MQLILIGKENKTTKNNLPFLELTFKYPNNEKVVKYYSISRCTKRVSYHQEWSHTDNEIMKKIDFLHLIVMIWEYGDGFKTKLIFSLFFIYR